MRVVFLDRDGVINRFPGIGRYVTTLKQLHVLPGARKGIRLLTRAGFKLHVISNQGCVAHGFITKADLARFTRILNSDIRKAGGKLHKFHYCLHRSADNCACKKPKTLLMKRALKGSRVRPADTFFVGDSDVDMLAGKHFGSRTVLVLTGRTKKGGVKSLPVKPDAVKKNLYEAAKWILKQKRS